MTYRIKPGQVWTKAIWQIQEQRWWGWKNLCYFWSREEAETELSSLNSQDLDEATPQPKLEELLKKSANHVMTEEEMQAQRESWARGEKGIGLDREEVAYRNAMAQGKVR